MTDAPEQIWQRASKDFDLTTCAGRVSADNAARALLSKIDDENLRSHAEHFVRLYRKRAFEEADAALGFGADSLQKLAARITGLEERVSGFLTDDIDF